MKIKYISNSVMFMLQFLGSTLYALWFSMLYLSIITTLNRFISVVFASYYSIIFERRNVKVAQERSDCCSCVLNSRFTGLRQVFQIMYFLAFMIFLIAWVVKLTPYSSYIFNMTDLSWTYAKDDSYILSRLSHYFGTYGIVVEVICAVTAYTVIFANILVRRKRSLKLSEMVLTIQHFCVSLLYVFGFIYWDFIDVWNDANVVTNFFSILTWIFIVGLNPFIYLSVNR
ncbi:hypothetical protein COOONC_02372 [Cooperia oncophora]